MRVLKNLICVKCNKTLMITDEGKCYYCELMKDDKSLDTLLEETADSFDKESEA